MGQFGSIEFYDSFSGTWQKEVLESSLSSHCTTEGALLADGTKVDFTKCSKEGPVAARCAFYHKEKKVSQVEVSLTPEVAKKR